MSAASNLPSIVTFTEIGELERALLDARRCLARALADNIAMHDTLGHAQGRCTELLMENRALKAKGTDT